MNKELSIDVKIFAWFFIFVPLLVFIFFFISWTTLTHLPPYEIMVRYYQEEIGLDLPSPYYMAKFIVSLFIIILPFFGGLFLLKKSKLGRRLIVAMVILWILGMLTEGLSFSLTKQSVEPFTLESLVELLFCVFVFWYVTRKSVKKQLR